MKKRILIVIPSYNHGGTNRSLRNLLKFIDFNRFEVNIYAMYPVGPYLSKFINYKIETGTLFLASNKSINILIKEFFSKKIGVYKFLKIILNKIKIKFLLKNDYKRLYKEEASKLSNLDYDIVISFQEGNATEFASYIEAKKKVAWVRCDYSRYLGIKKKSYNENYIYSKYDSIIAVSQYTAEVFKKQLPMQTSKVKNIYNIIDSQGIKEDAEKIINDNRFFVAPYTILSIGRFDDVKQFEKIPFIAKKIKDRGIPFCWYIIGDGKNKNKILDNCNRCNVIDDVILLGSKDNPYPYLKSSNVLVCTSISEACPNVINEAKILHIPVVSTNFPSAHEFIEHGVDGFLSSIDLMHNDLIKLYEDKDLYNTIKYNIKDFNYDNSKIYRQIESLFTGEPLYE